MSTFRKSDFPFCLMLIGARYPDEYDIDKRLALSHTDLSGLRVRKREMEGDDVIVKARETL